MNADCKSWSLRFLVLFLVSGMAASMVTAQVVEQEIPAGQPSIQFSEADEHRRYVHLVRFAEPGMLHRRTRASGARFDPNTPAMQAARADIQSEQQAHIQSMADAIGRSLDVTHYYLATHTGHSQWSGHSPDANRSGNRLQAGWHSGGGARTGVSA